jgi:hypothetical protein
VGTFRNGSRVASWRRWIDAAYSAAISPPLSDSATRRFSSVRRNHRSASAAYSRLMRASVARELCGRLGDEVDQAAW